MPRTAKPSSALRTPFDRLLGSVGAVRVVRVLARESVPLSQAELARRAQLNLRGLARIVNALAQGGLIEFVGSGHSRQLRLRDCSPLSPAVRQLFQAEAIRSDTLTQRLRELGVEFARAVRSLWLEGKVVGQTDTADAAIEVGVLWAGLPAADAREAVQRRLNAIQEECDVLLELRPRTDADLESATIPEQRRLDDVLPVFGPAPADLLRSRRAAMQPTPRKQTRSAKRPTHATMDERARRAAARIADHLLRDPAIVEQARAWVDRRSAVAGDAERFTLSEWRGVLDTLSLSQLRTFLRSGSERAVRLRQSLPFVDVLSQKERDALFEPKKMRK